MVLSILIFEIGFSQDQSVRTVYLKTPVDEEFRSKEMWGFEIKQYIADSSKDLEKYFGIKFQIQKIEHWFSDNAQTSVSELLSDLRKKVDKEAYEVF